MCLIQIIGFFVVYNLASSNGFPAPFLWGCLGYYLAGKFARNVLGMNSDVEVETSYSNGNDSNTYTGSSNPQELFLQSLMLMSAYIIRADGRVMHSEMEYVRNFLRQNLGEASAKRGNEMLLQFFNDEKNIGTQMFRNRVMQSARLMAGTDYSVRLQLLYFLVGISKADGVVAAEEEARLKELTMTMGLPLSELSSMLNMSSGNGHATTASSLEAAYKVLDIPSNATDDEVRQAYKKMVLKHHPDRVASLGEEVRKAAETKMQQINEAKDIIYKARGMN